MANKTGWMTAIPGERTLRLWSGGARACRAMASASATGEQFGERMIYAAAALGDLSCLRRLRETMATTASSMSGDEAAAPLVRA